MKKIIAFMGSSRSEKNTDIIVDKLLEGINSLGIITEKILLKDYNINGCKGCFSCSQTGKCIVKDDMENLYTKIEKSDGFIFASPSYNYNITSQMKALIDRLYCYFEFNENGWTSRLKDNKQAIVVGLCGGPNKDFMGYTMEAMEKPLKDLNINIYKKLPYYNTVKKPVKYNLDFQDELIKIGKEFGMDLNK